MRPNNRLRENLRLVTFEPGVSLYAEGSCLVKFGNTHVLCTASVALFFVAKPLGLCILLGAAMPHLRLVQHWTFINPGLTIAPFVYTLTWLRLFHHS